MLVGIGHKEFDGCLRCHNGKHESKDGEVISNDCNLCHSILMQGSKNNMQYAEIDSTLEFKHPVDIDQAWKEMKCSECHRQLF